MNPLIRVLYVLIAISTLGCGDTDTHSESTTDQQPASASLSIIWPTPGPENPDLDRSAAPRAQLEDCPVQKVQCIVYGDAGEELTSHTWNCSDHKGSINDIPPGPNRQFVVFGLDENDRIVYRGQADGGYDCNPGEALDVGHIMAEPFIPLLSKPADGENLRVLNPMLTWDAVNGASGYQIAISENSDLSEPVIDGYAQTANYKVSGLTKTIIYYVRVSAVDAQGKVGEASQIRSFTVDAITLPDTGQTEDHTQNPGEDSDYEINPPTYTKLDETGRVLADDATAWAAVKDETTGLIWEVKTTDGIQDTATRYTWDEVQENLITPLNDDGLGGCEHWRLPTIRELFGLMNYGTAVPSINQDYFPNTNSDWAYWSSTARIAPSELVRFVFIGSGTSNSREKADTPLHARAVCCGPTGGQIHKRLVDNQNGTVTDELTGLMWQKSAGNEAMVWENALQYCDTLELGGHDDWRLPNIKEMESIVDYSKEFPAIDTDYFNVADPDNPRDERFWSSTSSVHPDKQNHALYVFINHGHIQTVDKSGVHYVRAVRSLP